MFLLSGYFVFLALHYYWSYTIEVENLWSYCINVSCLHHCLFSVLVCFMNCSTLFYVYLLCHLPVNTFANFLKVISLSAPHMVSSICQISMGVKHSATVFTFSLIWCVYFVLLVLLSCLLDSLSYQSLYFAWLHLIWFFGFFVLQHPWPNICSLVILLVF